MEEFKSRILSLQLADETVKQRCSTSFRPKCSLLTRIVIVVSCLESARIQSKSGGRFGY